MCTCTGVILVVRELVFLNVRSVEALHMAQYVPLDEDQHTLPYFARLGGSKSFFVHNDDECDIRCNHDLVLMDDQSKA